MESAFNGHEAGGRENVGGVIPPWADSDLLAAVAALPNVKIGAHAFDWTPERNAALLAGWPCKRKIDVAAAIGCNYTTAKKQWEKLTGGHHV